VIGISEGVEDLIAYVLIPRLDPVQSGSPVLTNSSEYPFLGLRLHQVRAQTHAKAEEKGPNDGQWNCIFI
jgi:hypothetical protein